MQTSIKLEKAAMDLPECAAAAHQCRHCCRAIARQSAVASIRHSRVSLSRTACNPIPVTVKVRHEAVTCCPPSGVVPLLTRCLFVQQLQAHFLGFLTTVWTQGCSYDQQQQKLASNPQGQVHGAFRLLEAPFPSERRSRPA